MPFQGTKLIFFSGERKATLRQWKGENPSLYGASILVPSALVPLEES